MKKTVLDKELKHGGFVPLRQIGKKEALNYIFEKKVAKKLYDKIWDAEGKLVEHYSYKASIDLHLGREAYISTNEEPENLEEGDKTITIHSGEFALLKVFEKIRIPLNLMAFIGIRFRYKKKGLINVSGFHVDPGFEGYLTFSVYNAGPNPVVLRYLDKMFTIWFVTLTDGVDKSYNDAPSVEHKYNEPRISASDIEAIKGPPISMPKISKRLDTLEAEFKLIIALMVGIMVSLIGIFFTK